MTIQLHLSQPHNDIGFLIICQAELTLTRAFPADLAQEIYRVLAKMNLEDEFAPEYDAVLEKYDHLELHYDARRMDAKLTAGERWELIAEELKSQVAKVDSDDEEDWH